ncbi:MAG: DUF4131 domain-containing protein [Actinomycetota bacterium]|nr:DUF4131 domain-containing protein [Actinomycetota bacterium]
MRPSRTGRPDMLGLDLSPPVRLDLWALTLATGVVAGTVVPPLAPVLVVSSAIVSAGALLWRDLVREEWRLMAILAPLFVAGGVGIAVLHAATRDPLAELAALEPGEVVIVGRIASPPAPMSWGYGPDLWVEHLWYEGREVLRGGGVKIFAGDLAGAGAGDRVRVDGEISLPDPGEGDFDYARYLRAKESVRHISSISGRTCSRCQNAMASCSSNP